MKLLQPPQYPRRPARGELLNSPKSRKSRRVDMSLELRRTLLELPRSATSDSDLVFPSEAGTPIEMNNFSERVFKPLLKEVGLRTIRFHDLRHTFGSLLIQTGASLAYVRNQRGHSARQVTVDIDGHPVPAANISFVHRLDYLTLPLESARK